MAQSAMSRGRWRLVVLAVFTAGFPCLLATGCSGAPAAPAAPGSASPAAAEPAGAAATPAAARHGTRRTSTLALRLMRQAALAAVRTDYQGEEIMSRSDAGGGTYLVSNVWHTGTGPTLTQVQTAGPAAATQPYWPQGVLGVTAPLVALLARNYVITYAGTGTAGSLRAQVVQAWRADDSLAATFWLDSSTKLPLEREVFDSAARPVSLDVFVNVKVGRHASLPPPRPQQAGAQAWAHDLTPAELALLARHGWVVPPGLPGGLTLFAGGQRSTATGTVLDLAYSDGLAIISVFEEHGKLAPRLAGWQKTKLNGVVVYVAEPSQRSFTWTGKGMVYTLIADAPLQAVGNAVRTLPHDQPPGFWRRVTHGLARLADLVNPFG